MDLRGLRIYHLRAEWISVAYGFMTYELAESI